MRKKLQNSKSYAESPVFLPARLFIFKKKSVATTTVLPALRVNSSLFSKVYNSTL